MWNWLKNFKKKYQSEALILMYHRVTTLSIDPWKLAVSPANFEEQIQYLKLNHTIIPLEELPLAFDKGLKNPVAISFDDGYADNFLEARPILEAHNAPASFFICTSNIASGKPFWWDRLQQIVLNNPVLPQQLSIPALKGLPVFDLTGEEFLNPDLAEKMSRWNFDQPPPGKRCLAFLAIWKEIKKMSPYNQWAILNDLQLWAGIDSTEAENGRPMTSTELKILAANPLFRIGAHSVNHPQLSLCPIEIQKKEIIESREYLEELTGKSITSFAYPFGDYNDESCEILKAGDFTHGLTTENATVKLKTNPYKWGRYMAENISGKEFEAAIKNQLKGGGG